VNGSELRVAGAGAAALLGVVFVAPGVLTDGPVLCPMRRLTGHPCPACGLTRSVVSSLHGHLGDALAFHPFGPVFVLIVVAVAAIALARAAGVTTPVERLRAVVEPARLPAVFLLAVAWAGWYTTRLV
jgi:hypothetical protein